MAKEKLVRTLGFSLILGLGGWSIYSLKQYSNLQLEAQKEYIQSKNNFLEPTEYKFSMYPIDQVFRDHNKYRIYYQDEKGQVVEGYKYKSSICGVLGENIYPNISEMKYFSHLGDGDRSNLRIFKDVDKREHPYLVEVKYNVEVPFGLGDEKPSQTFNCRYVEIHLKSNQGLEPGLEQWGHHPAHIQKGEIREIE